MNSAEAEDTEFGLVLRTRSLSLGRSTGLGPPDLCYVHKAYKAPLGLGGLSVFGMKLDSPWMHTERCSRVVWTMSRIQHGKMNGEVHLLKHRGLELLAFIFHERLNRLCVKDVVSDGCNYS